MSHRTDWFKDAKWGVMCHYVGKADETPATWNRRVEQFDVAKVADQLARVGAGYFLLTVGQNSGYWCSPNATYDRLTDITPSKCSSRDLIAEMAAALGPRGIRQMVYIPCHAPGRDIQAVEALQCTPPWDASNWGRLRPGTYRSRGETDARLTAFQRHWEAIIREWSDRWGSSVHGWWVDGCYYPEVWDHPDEPNFASFAAAMRSGNADSIVAFSGGLKEPAMPITEHQDYTGGEACGRLFVGGTPSWPIGRPTRWRDGAQLHILTYVGESWGGRQPRFPTDLVVGYTRFITGCEGVVTWDAGISEDGIAPPCLEQLGELGRAITRG